MGATRELWLDEGIRLLRAGGAGAVRADRLAAQLGLTKGSFHHHFAGMADYRRALLDRCIQQNAAAVAWARSSVAALEATSAITALPDLLGPRLDVPLDAALRGWAVEDEVAREAMAAIDAERLGLLTELWSRLLGDQGAGRIAALVPHLIAVGASVSPGVSAEDLQDVYELLARLVPPPSAVDSEHDQTPRPGREE